MKILEIIDELEKNSQIKEIKNFERKTSEDVEISDITYNSKEAKKNSLFICKGNAFKREYLLDSIKNGSVAYISEIDYSDYLTCEKMRDMGCEQPIITIVVKDVRLSMGILANLFFDRPWKEISLIAFGGTKGKSTATYMLKKIIDDTKGKLSGVISSIEVFDGKNNVEAGLTTPEAMELQRILRREVENKIDFCSMEVSSQALKYHRTYGMRFKVGIFLNMGYDHISPLEHENFDDYFNSKMIMMTQCENLVINKDSDHIDEILNIAEKNISSEKIFTYSIKDENADMYGKDIKYDVKQNKSIFTLVDNRDGKTYDEVSLNMIGDFNVSNAVSAILAAKILGIKVEDAAKTLDNILVKGRMNIVTAQNGNIVAIVDYAHNKMSFENLFDMIKRIYEGYRIVAVFGCPGGKAFNRRKELAQVASEYADRIILVPEDSNYEDPDEISNDILKYVNDESKAEILHDREFGIVKTLKESEENFIKTGEKTVIAITGKGWETTMKVEGKNVPIKSDMKIVTENLY